MSSPKSHRKVGGSDKSKRGRLPEKSFSFHGKADRVVAELLPRSRTVPDLLSGRRISADDVTHPPAARLTKLLLNVTIQRSLGAVRVMMAPEASVEDLVAAALRQYAKEQRLPVVHSSDASEYELHYSQFSLESLDRDEKLVALGSRNFFLCPRTTAEAATEGGDPLTSRCSKGSKKEGSNSWSFCCRRQ